MRKTLLARILTTFALILLLGGMVHAGEVTLAWDPNTDPDIAGYVLWYGAQSGRYITSIDVGNRTRWTLTGLPEGQRYYFTVQAYNSVRTMSLFSSEVVADLPGASPQPGDGSTFSCQTLRPGPMWTCDPATGNWLPPASGGARGGNRASCRNQRPGGDGPCDPSEENPLPRVNRAKPSASSAQPAAAAGEEGEALYLYQPVAGSELTGWALLSPVRADVERFDVVRNDTTIGQWSHGPTVGDLQFTNAGRVVAPNTPGAADLVVWRQSTGMWYLLKSADGIVYTSQASVRWGDGAAGNVPVPADYDGDGTTDLGVWQPSTGTWSVLKSSETYDSQRPLLVQWGQSGDVPIPADYDGDGKADPAILRAPAGDFYILKSSDAFNGQSYVKVSLRAQAVK